VRRTFRAAEVELLRDQPQQRAGHAGFAEFLGTQFRQQASIAEAQRLVHEDERVVPGLVQHALGQPGAGQGGGFFA